MPELKVLKKNGNVEDFNIEKLKKSLEAAGVEENRALQISTEIYKDLFEVSSAEIRRRAIKKLRKFNSKAADSIIEYDLQKAEKEHTEQNFVA